MSDQDHGHSLCLVQLTNRPDHFRSSARIQHGSGFIQHDALRLHRDHSRDRDSLFLSSGQAVGRRASHFPHADRPQGLLNPCPDILCGYPHVFRPESDVLLYHGGDDLIVGILEYHARALTDVPQTGFVPGIIPVHVESPLRWKEQSIQLPGKRRLAGAVVSQNGNKLSRFNLKIDPVQCSLGIVHFPILIEMLIEK